MYNVKNYTEPGGEKTVIGGTLEIKEGAEVTGLKAGGGGCDLPHRAFAPVKNVKELGADATLATVISAVNDIRESLYQHAILRGYLMPSFTLVEHPTITHEILKANTEACEVALNRTEDILTVKADPDRLTAFESGIAPYSRWGARKYIAIQINVGTSTGLDALPQVNGETYFGDSFKDEYGMDDNNTLNALLPVDLLKEGYNHGALTYALEDHGGVVVHVLFQKV